MKRFYIYLLVFVVAISILFYSACINVDVDQLKVTPTELKFNAIDESAKILKVMSNAATWTFEKSSDEWFHVRQDADSLIVTVDEYVEIDDSRQGTITVMAGASPSVTVNVEQLGGNDFVFEKSGEVILNPGQGWLIYGPTSTQTAATIAMGTTGYHRYNWSAINPSEGVYNWNTIDNDISSWALHGKQFAFGVMNVNATGNSYYCTPKWVFDKGAKYTKGNGDDASDRKYYIPVWDDPVYVEECAKFAAKLAERYDGNPNIAFIDVRNYGNWGEMHMLPFSRYTESLSVEKVESLLLQPYIDNFKKTQLIVCWGMFFTKNVLETWAVSKGIGLRCDGIMGYNNGDELARAIGKEPTAWEFPYSYKAHEIDRTFPWDDNKFMNIIKANRPSYIGMGHWGDDARYFLSKKPELIKEVANLMGFNFSVTTASYINKISNGEALDISLSIENSGVTNMLTDCVIKLALLDDNNKVVSAFTTDWNAKSIAGGETAVFKSSAVFKDTPAGTYKLAIGLYRDANDQKPTYNLDNKNRTQDGLYVLGILGIEK